MTNTTFLKDICTNLNLIDSNFKFKVINNQKIIFPEFLCKNINIIINELNNHTTNIDFSFFIFEGELDFSGVSFEKTALFVGCTFLRKVSFNKSNFKNGVLFSSSIFEENVIFGKIFLGKNTAYIPVAFNNYINFYNVSFLKYADFNGIYFNGVTYFSEAKFFKGADFTNTCFKEDSYFDEILSNDTLNFSDADFIKKANFKNLTSFNLIFFNTTFRDIINFQNSSVKNELSFHQAIFFNYARFFIKKVKYLKFDDSFYSLGFSFLCIAEENIENIELASQKTYCLLKNVANYTNNKRLKNLMFCREMSQQLALLKNNKCSLFDDDFIILTFNKISNNFGLSWKRGIIFTLVSSLIFFVLYSFSAQDLSIKSFLTDKFFQNFLIFLYPGFFEKNFSNSISILFYFIGKVFIFLGLYQTIQAFRKLHEQ